MENNAQPPNQPPPNPQPPYQSPYSQYSVQPQKKRNGWKIFLGIILGFSIFFNIVLFMALIFVSMFSFVGAGGRDYYIEEVIKKGPAFGADKILVINLDGIIDEMKSQDIINQLKRAQEDSRIKGIILRVNSPGGLVSASDEIYNEILKYRDLTNQPVIAFMQGVAASGGYYCSAACEKIIAEPTVITGSIGVIMNYFVISELLEGKLGIEPVIIKSGQKKDWPSMFSKPDEMQIQYLNEKIITPAYDRFVGIVDDSRKQLSLEEVKQLADGSIFSAQQAVDGKLIDKVGYIDDAINQVLTLASIKDAQVVEYTKPFSLAKLFSIQTENILKIDKTTLHSLSTPQVLYLWSIY
jgi:protease-4